MFILKKNFRFESSHQLLYHDGKCARLHGHSWNGSILVSGKALLAKGPKENMLIDYGDLGVIVKDLEALFDHRHLNDVLKTDMPTSEFLARAIFDLVKEQLDPDVKLEAVRIAETCTTECEFREAIPH